jgi:hypothetical protein
MAASRPKMFQKLTVDEREIGDLDAASDGFAATCAGEEALKPMEDSALTANRIVDMVRIDIS